MLFFFSVELKSGLIFYLADQIGVEASKAVHVGDDETADKAGANAIGLECWYA
jgi:FMN phosphatase YigB (HAD superfamily)